MKRVVANVDVGTDDALGLLLLLHADKIGTIKLEAILCSGGNTSVDFVIRNVVRLLEIAERTDIPIYKGASEQILCPDHEMLHFHGKDGFGDLEYPDEPNISIVKPEHAAVALGNIVNNNPKEISVVAVSPLTDIALTIKLFPNFGENLKELFIMGGNSEGVGNVEESAAEFNFYYDAEAAYITLENMKCPVYILTWETCLIPQITFDWRYDVLGAIKNPIIELLNKAEKSIYPSTEKIWISCDTYLVAAFLYPEIIKKQNSFYATVELNGKYTRGQMVLDHLKTKEPNVVIIEEVKQDLFENILLKAAEETM